MARRDAGHAGWRALDDEAGRGHRPQPPRPVPGPVQDPMPPGPPPDPNQVPVPNPAPQPNPTEGPQFEGFVLASDLWSSEASRSRARARGARP